MRIAAQAQQQHENDGAATETQRGCDLVWQLSDDDLGAGNAGSEQGHRDHQIEVGEGAGTRPVVRSVRPTQLVRAFSRRFGSRPTCI